MKPLLPAADPNMVTADLINNQKWDEMTELCKKSREIVEKARTGR